MSSSGEVISALPLAATVIATDQIIVNVGDGMGGFTTKRAALGTVGAVGTAQFSTYALAVSAQISASVAEILTLGYYVVGDGGGASYLRVGSNPGNPASFQSADGAWWLLSMPYVSPRFLGAKGDGVQNATTGAWTGTDDTTPMQNWEVAGNALNIPRYLPKGNFIVTAPIIPGTITRSNIIIYGDNSTQSCIVNKYTGTSSMYNVIGIKDSSAAVAVYLTADAAAGSRQVTLNRTDTLTVNQWVVIADQSQNVSSNQADGTICAKLGENVQVASIDDATHVTFMQQLQFNYGHNATPALSTTISRFTNPVQNMSVRDIGIEFDPTLTYSNTAVMFSFRRGFGFKAERVRMNNQATYGYSFSNTLRFETIDCQSQNAKGAIYLHVIDSGCAFGIIRGYRAYGGRHLVTTTSSATDIESANVLVDNCIAWNMNETAFDQHPMARDYLFTGCMAFGGGINAGAGTTGNGFDLRGRYSRVTGFKCSGLVNGIAAAYGNNNTFEAGDIRNCYSAVTVLKANDIEFKGIKAYDTYGPNVIEVNSEITATHIAYPGLRFADFVVYGNPSGAVVNTTNAVGADWVFGIRAATATTFQTGTSIPDAQIKSGYNEKSLLVASAVTLTNGATSNIVIQGVPPGEWFATGVVSYVLTGATVTNLTSGTSTASATLWASGTFVAEPRALTTVTGTYEVVVPGSRMVFSATSNAYLVGQATFSAGTVKAYGTLKLQKLYSS